MVLHDLPLQRALTGFGDITVTGPAALAAALWFARFTDRATTLRFALPVAATFAVISLLKMVMRAKGGAFAGSAFALSAGAPSGHMGMSSVVYGGLAMILLHRRRNALALATALVTALGLVAIAITRVTLHAHLPADVAAGLLFGGAAAAWMARTISLPARISEGQVTLLVLAVAGALALMRASGLHVDSARLI